MQCKNHPDRTAEFFCASCNAPLCEECAEEAKPGEYYCFQCAMIHSVSEAGVSIKDRRDKTVEKKERKKKRGPFQYFVIVSSVLILVMWGVIIFGGQKAPRRKTIDFAKKGRVLLFMVDGAIKRYAHYEGNKYPEKLSDLVPKYLSLRKDDLFHLAKLSYKRDPNAGYWLSFAKPKPDEMNIIISPKGIKYAHPSSKVPE